MAAPRGELAGRIAGICDRVLDAVGPARHAGVVRAVRAGLDEPLRVAVTGRVNAGKSTLVNALLGQRVAATDVSECTRLVTWYRHGVPERVEVAYREAPPVRLALTPDGRVPPTLPEVDDDVTHLDVYLANDALRNMVLIDTPGLSSADEARRRGTMSLLALDVASRVAVAQADAVVYVLTEGMVRSEAEILAGFRETTGGLAPTALSAVAVLNKADHLDDPDQLAARYANDLRRSVAAVVPLVGLLAETVDCGRFGERHAAAIRALAELPDESFASLILTTDRFVNADAPVSAEDRAELLATLDLWGIGCAVADARAGTSATAMVEGLRARSGIDRLRSLLTDSFARNADVLKAAAALAALERAAFLHGDSWPPGVREGLRDELEEIDLDPAMHRLREVRAVQEWSAGEVDLPSELEADLRRLAGGGPPHVQLGLDGQPSREEMQAAALQAASRWKQFANDSRATTRQRWVAGVAARSYELLWSAAGRAVS